VPSNWRRRLRMSPANSGTTPNYVARTERREQTRAQILDRAAKLFYRRGITGVGMQEVAEYIPVSKPTLYKHFATKEALIAECLSSVDEQHFQWFVDQLARQYPQEDLPAVAVFDVLDKWVKSSAFRGCAFINASVEVGSSNPPAQVAVFRHKDRTRKWLRELSEASGVSAGSSEPIAAYLMLLMEGAIITALVESDETAALSAKEAARILLGAALP